MPMLPLRRLPLDDAPMPPFLPSPCHEYTYALMLLFFTAATPPAAALFTADADAFMLLRFDASACGVLLSLLLSTLRDIDGDAGMRVDI